MCHMFELSKIEKKKKKILTSKWDPVHNYTDKQKLLHKPQAGKSYIPDKTWRKSTLKTHIPALFATGTKTSRFVTQNV
jgi:hypothetical protein